MYRPKGWPILAISDDHYTISFEVGANAMLFALRKEGEHISLAPYGSVLIRSSKLGEKGTLVFIPDEPETNKEEG